MGRIIANETCVIINLISSNPCSNSPSSSFSCNCNWKNIEIKTRKCVIRIFNDWKCDANWKARHATVTSSTIWPIPLITQRRAIIKAGEANNSEWICFWFPVTSFCLKIYSFSSLLVANGKATSQVRINVSHSRMIPWCVIRNRFRFCLKLNPVEIPIADWKTNTRFRFTT